MQILTYSDLHLEFGVKWSIPRDLDGDVLVLAGDIVTFADPTPMRELLNGWTKPVLYVPGNHEYYTRQPMSQGEKACRQWLAESIPNVRLLLNEVVTIGGVNFFGGTMWTDFDRANPIAMLDALRGMSDFDLIRNANRSAFAPAHSIDLHNRFRAELTAWLRTELIGPRVVISHHAPVVKRDTRFAGSKLQPAFNSLDMVEVILEHQPDLWIYGHTHECDDQMVGGTRVISNQKGYGSERTGFDPGGLKISLDCPRQPC